MIYHAPVDLDENKIQYLDDGRACYDVPPEPPASDFAVAVFVSGVVLGLVWVSWRIWKD